MVRVVHKSGSQTGEGMLSGLGWSVSWFGGALDGCSISTGGHAHGFVHVRICTKSLTHALTLRDDPCVCDRKTTRFWNMGGKTLQAPQAQTPCSSHVCEKESPEQGYFSRLGRHPLIAAWRASMQLHDASAPRNIVRKHPSTILIGLFVVEVCSTHSRESPRHQKPVMQWH